MIQNFYTTTWFIPLVNTIQNLVIFNQVRYLIRFFRYESIRIKFSVMFIDLTQRFHRVWKHFFFIFGSIGLRSPLICYLLQCYLKAIFITLLSCQTISCEIFIIRKHIYDLQMSCLTERTLLVTQDKLIKNCQICRGRSHF